MLETKIDELIAALDRNTAAVLSQTESPDEVSPSEPESPPPGGKAAPKTKAAPKKKATPKTKKKAAAPAPVSQVATAPDPVALKKLISDVGLIAKELGPRAQELNKLLVDTYGCKKVSELPIEQYDNFLAECRKVSAS